MLVLYKLAKILEGKNRVKLFMMVGPFQKKIRCNCAADMISEQATQDAPIGSGYHKRSQRVFALCDFSCDLSILFSGFRNKHRERNSRGYRKGGDWILVFK